MIAGVLEVIESGVDEAEAAGAEMTVSEGEAVTAELVTTSWISAVVPSETVSCSAGEAKECQSNVTDSDVTNPGVGLAILIVKPVASMSWT